ncbi:helix-turn-helix domain-containing protein [Novacetimonas pomaceti]|uniref:Transcriptional regulator n=1 Tax=Novacetimonas pomaceti TaxID=2021998 RepID=A0ABX5P093_9PROT|nr:helix-turn-helix transcriptional regulator [Novacetimonas pomaceti]PYD47160.1 transcriptional regulator [Novacetimonas pomaceti]
MKKLHTQPGRRPASRRTRPPRIDWTVLDPHVARLRADGLSNRETARRLNLNVKTMESRLRHLRVHRVDDSTALGPDEVRRTCLNCDGVFIADGRFLRLCPTCRAMFG